MNTGSIHALEAKISRLHELKKIISANMPWVEIFTEKAEKDMKALGVVLDLSPGEYPFKGILASAKRMQEECRNATPILTELGSLCDEYNSLAPEVLADLQLLRKNWSQDPDVLRLAKKFIALAN